MGLYSRYVLPRLLDFAMRDKPIMRQRAKVVPLAHGRVLEVGIGADVRRILPSKLESDAA